MYPLPWRMDHIGIIATVSLSRGERIRPGRYQMPNRLASISDERARCIAVASRKHPRTLPSAQVVSATAAAPQSKGRRVLAMNRLSPFALSLLLVACAAAAPAAESESVAASALPSPSAAATTIGSTRSPEPTPASATTPPGPTTAPDVGWGFLPPGGEARVTVDVGLRLRAEPGTESAIVATLAKGTLVRMAGPPWQRSAADGFVWRWVIVESNPQDSQAGWVATVGPGTFLTVEPLDCPTGAVDLQTVISMSELARLTCLRGQELTLEGTIVTGFGGFVFGNFEPGWLAHPFGFDGAISAADCCFFYHQPPGSERTTGVDGDRLRVTGHFDDPAAQNCHIATGDPPVPEPDELAVVYCRERFVATSVEVVGD